MKYIGLVLLVLLVVILFFCLKNKKENMETSDSKLKVTYENGIITVHSTTFNEIMIFDERTNPLKTIYLDDGFYYLKKSDIPLKTTNSNYGLYFVPVQNGKKNLSEKVMLDMYQNEEFVESPSPSPSPSPLPSTSVVSTIKKDVTNIVRFSKRVLAL